MPIYLHRVNFSPIQIPSITGVHAFSRHFQVVGYNEAETGLAGGIEKLSICHVKLFFTVLYF